MELTAEVGTLLNLLAYMPDSGALASPVGAAMVVLIFEAIHCIHVEWEEMSLAHHEYIRDERLRLISRMISGLDA